MSHIDQFVFRSRDGRNVTIRTACEDDAQGILAVGKAVLPEADFNLTELDEFSMTEDEERAWIKGHLAHPAKLILVAEVEGEIVGCLDFANGHRRRIAHTGHFGMSILKAWRELGIGTAMLDLLLQWAKAHPLIEKVCLFVHATNERAIHVYRKHGFVAEGRRRKEIKVSPTDYVDTIVMAKFV